VAKIRRLASQKRVGHAGTLDPMAEGVLPVLLGRATRLADYIQDGHKAYVATVKLGAATDTDDAEGAVVSESPVPTLSEGLLDETLHAFLGEINQIPPRYSALKIAGQRAYAVARRGGSVDLAPRPVTIHELRLLGWSSGQLQLDVTCSKGTYIRALARDIAAALGTVGHLTGLTRTQAGPFALADALTLEDIATRGVSDALLAASAALPDLACFRATPDQAVRLENGQAIEVAFLRGERVWVYDPDDRLVCLASVDGSLLRPRLAL
jgi:tRNA pseudouridine55 synthase